jgi:hypothetical protein
MNCQKFEEVVNDVAREQLIAVSVRAEALSHTRECVQCARRLDDERRLTSRLGGLAAAIGSIDAPQSVPARLFEAFDRRPLPALARFARASRASWIAAAAALLLVIGVLSGMIVRSRRSVPAADAGESLAVTNRPAQSEKQPEAPPYAPVLSLNTPRHRATLSGRKPARRHGFNESTNGRETMSHHSEIATDFFLITYGAVPLAEGGRIVRLMVPRSAMARYGLPVNMDRANEPVKADVILGLDNLPQAIRFVQEMDSNDIPNTKQSPATRHWDARKPRKEKKS